MNFKYSLLIMALSTLLSACGSSSSESPAYELKMQSINEISLVDALGQPIAGASVQIESQEDLENTQSTSSNLVYNLSQSASTDSNGNLIIDDLEPGEYTITITQNGVTVVTTLVITDNNASQTATVAAPIVQDGESTISLQDENGDYLAVFASISGIIYDKEGPVSGAQVELSGGDETNGAVALDVTDENGAYLLIVNVSLDKLQAMQAATFRVTKEGYAIYELTLDTTVALGFAGQNAAISSAQSVNTIYEETFEQVVSGATCGEWTAEDIILSYYFDETPSDEGAFMTNLWHEHDSGLSIVNAAIEEGLVNLAPNDISEGLVADPIDQHACWYGQEEAGNVGQGNFLGDLQEGYPENGGEDTGDGGTSLYANGGALVSPVFDFSSEVEPLSLTFKTWWEIESVNPNENGFDLLIIETSTDGGVTWADLARLNPLSDPETDTVDRSPIPYSSLGFNRAPQWISQEPIDISFLAGEANAKIRFVFLTQDELFNGFRGWLLDDVKVISQQGTFPYYEEPVYDQCGDDTQGCAIIEE